MTREEWAGTASATLTGGTRTLVAGGTIVTPDHLCPDLLSYEQIGGADGWRGRVVRAFFWALRAWPGGPR